MGNNDSNVDSIAVSLLLNAPFMDDPELKETLCKLRKLAKIKKGHSRMHIDEILDRWSCKAYQITMNDRYITH